MSPSVIRKNDPLLRGLVAVALAVITAAVLREMPFYPDWLALALAGATGVVALFSPGTATIVFVLVLSVPLVAADFVTGMFFLIAGLMVTQYLSTGRAGGFVLAALAIALVPLHAEWAAVAAAGYLVGRRRGALAGATACLALVAIGVVLGVPLIGSVATGGTAPGIISLQTPPQAPLGFGWLVPGIKATDAAAFFRALTGVAQPALVLAQVALWALAGALGSAFSGLRAKPLRLLGPALAVVLLALGHLVLDAAFSGPAETAALLTTSAVSLPLALALAAGATWLFPLVASSGPRVAQAARERDVDELLRTIAAAEDELASRHNTESVVLITDMKSFSSMTEELGSVGAAKVVQRHRDLLLPIIAKHHGKGAPTGGDGLVASFRAPADAVAAAVEMQQALEGYTGSDRSPHELSVRVGIASGEVVVDAAGIPFLGAALNLAARVMDLADGGRVMITSYVASTAHVKQGQLYRHGDFKLKNIAEVIPVVEVLWREGMAPQEIRAS
jgi:class 3 adenylate cyclase